MSTEVTSTLYKAFFIYNHFSNFQLFVSFVEFGEFCRKTLNPLVKHKIDNLLIDTQEKLIALDHL